MRRYLFLALLLLFQSAATAATYYVHGGAGNDSNSCSQAQSDRTPKRSVNAGIGCLAPGDVLNIGDSTYDELIVGQVDSTRNCQSNLVAIQPVCHAIPNGPDPERPTTLVAAADGAIISPQGRDFPGGGGIVTLFSTSKNLRFEGLKLVKNSASGSASSFVGGDAQSVTVTRSEIDHGSMKSSTHSKGFIVTHTHIHHAGMDVCPQGQKPTPSQCPHGVYMCGTDHVFTDNVVEYSSYYGVQYSCEGGGLARIKIERNTVRYNATVGIRCAATDCTVASNLLVGNGSGITLTGSGLVASNTIAGVQEASWNEDPTAIWTTYGDGSGFSIQNNIITGFGNSYLLIGNADNAPPDTSKVRNNACDLGGNPGCVIQGSAASMYRNADQQDYTLKQSKGNPAIGAGTPTSVTTDVRGRPYSPQHPSVGAYALELPQPTPPEPPQPPGAITLACSGDLLAAGRIQLVCTQQEGAR